MAVKIEERMYNTVTDGLVTTIAREFAKFPTQGAKHTAFGPVWVTASRNAVVVRRAECRSAQDMEVLEAALERAKSIFNGLNRAHEQRPTTKRAARG